MTAAERQTHLEWCQAFIEQCCVLRSPPDRSLLIGHGGSLATWQAYLPVALLDQQFAHRLGLLFWDHYLATYRRRPFQIGGCESGGVLLMCILQATAYELGLDVNVFQIRKEAKEYALKNWLEGVVLDRPVLVVDDLIGKKATITRQSKRLREFGFEIVGAFAVMAPLLTLPQTIELEPPIALTIIYGPHNFALSHDAYVLKHGKPPPPFQGSLR